VAVLSSRGQAKRVVSAPKERLERRLAAKALQTEGFWGRRKGLHEGATSVGSAPIAGACSAQAGSSMVSAVIAGGRPPFGQYLLRAWQAVSLPSSASIQAGGRQP
jgi:hypothetical protein